MSGMPKAPAAVAQHLPKPAELEELQGHAQAASRLLKLMGSEQRLILLCRLGEGECSVGDLAAYVGLAQSAASQHLAKLRAEGLVATRREGQTIYYRLVDPAAARIIETLCEIYRAGRPEWLGRP
jgi:ArsR family transcriptional regulator, virulence genes transcriptional regulator